MVDLPIGQTNFELNHPRVRILLGCACDPTSKVSDTMV